jgi:probable O-glycosylation ligase (exosortase A-associated)
MVLMLGRLKQRMLLILVIVMASLIVVIFAPDRWKQRMDPGGEVIDSSAQSRFNSWTFCWRLALDHPIAGGGFATFTPELFDHYAPKSLDVHNSHSIYFGVLAEHGFVGLLLFGAVVWSCFATTGRLIKRARFYEDDRAISYANMFRFSIVGFMVSGAFLSRTYFDYFYAIVACIAILNRICLSEWKSMDEQACEVEEMVT